MLNIDKYILDKLSSVLDVFTQDDESEGKEEYTIFYTSEINRDSNYLWHCNLNLECYSDTEYNCSVYRDKVIEKVLALADNVVISHVSVNDFNLETNTETKKYRYVGTCELIYYNN